MSKPNYPMSPNTQSQNTQDWNNNTNKIIKNVLRLKAPELLEY